MRFHDRRDAGRQLAAFLVHLKGLDPLVLALVRGGVVVAAEVARALGAPLDLIVVRKIGAPHQPEYAIGAVAPGVVALRRDAIDALGIPAAEVQACVAREQAALDDAERRYRVDRPAITITGRTAIVVDDGLATGATATAALRSARLEEPRRLVLAVPICSPETAGAIAREADEVVCVHQPRDLAAVGQWYDDFTQVSDEEVRELLASAPSTGRADGSVGRR